MPYQDSKKDNTKKRSKSRRRSRSKSKKRSRRRRSLEKYHAYSSYKKRSKSRRRSRSKSKKRPIFKFDSQPENKCNLSQPLTIYTKEGCGACSEAKKICEEKGIKFRCFEKKDYEEKIKKDTNGYKYVPVIFDSNGVFIGGASDLKKLISK